MKKSTMVDKARRSVDDDAASGRIRADLSYPESGKHRFLVAWRALKLEGVEPTLSEAGRRAGVPTGTWGVWRKRDREFREALQLDVRSESVAEAPGHKLSEDDDDWFQTLSDDDWTRVMCELGFRIARWLAGKDSGWNIESWEPPPPDGFLADLFGEHWRDVVAQPFSSAIEPVWRALGRQGEVDWGPIYQSIPCNETWVNYLARYRATPAFTGSDPDSIAQRWNMQLAVTPTR